MLKTLLLLSIWTSLSFCAVLDQAQKVIQDVVSHVPQATIKDMSSTTEVAAIMAPTPFTVIVATFPTVNVQCLDGQVTRTFTVQYTQDSVTQAAECWAENAAWRCGTAAANYYPKQFDNHNNLTLPDYCVNEHVWSNRMQEFPVKTNGALYAGAGHVDNDNGLFRVIYKVTKLTDGSGMRQLRYCGIVRHAAGGGFTLC